MCLTKLYMHQSLGSLVHLIRHDDQKTEIIESTLQVVQRRIVFQGCAIGMILTRLS